MKDPRMLKLCRQLIRYRPARIVLFDVSEIALYQIERELAEVVGAAGISCVPVLGTVTEWRQVRAVLADHKVDVILHGNDPGIAEAASEFGMIHVPDVAANQNGVPYMDDMLKLIRKSVLWELVRCNRHCSGGPG